MKDLSKELFEDLPSKVELRVYLDNREVQWRTPESAVFKDYQILFASGANRVEVGGFRRGAKYQLASAGDCAFLVGNRPVRDLYYRLQP